MPDLRFMTVSRKVFEPAIVNDTYLTQCRIAQRLKQQDLAAEMFMILMAAGCKVAPWHQAGTSRHVRLPSETQAYRRIA